MSGADASIFCGIFNSTGAAAAPAASSRAPAESIRCLYILSLIDLLRFYGNEGVMVCGAPEAVMHFSNPFGISARPSFV